MTDQTGHLRAHVFTNVAESLFLKHFRDFSPVMDGVSFSFGMDVPKDIDVLIVYTRASYSIPTSLPPERTVFIAAEPDVIHPYSTRFLNQFGIALTSTDKPLTTDQWRTACCTIWFAGVDFSTAEDGFPIGALKGHDWFAQLEIPEKQDRISIVTSNKSFTTYHQKRLQFIEALTKLIPDRIEMFGRGFRSVDDKKDALLPYRYHLAIENCDGPDLWTEKLADPFLCWAFPFYAGCTNAETYFPAESFHLIDLDRPEDAARDMVRMMENGHWQKALPHLTEARRRVLSVHNPADLFVRLVRAAMAKPVSATRGRRLVRSERSLWPEAGAKGSVPEWALRNLLLSVDPRAELRLAPVQAALEARRARRRAARANMRENARNGSA